MKILVDSRVVVRNKAPRQSQEEEMIDARKELGNSGEKIDARFLRKQG